MTQYTKETVTTNGGTQSPNAHTSTEVEDTSTQTAAYLIYFLFGLLEVLLAFRLIFKLVGASHGSAFVTMIYSITGLFIMPFLGIFRTASGTGVETTAILEPATLVAIVVYAVLAWGIVALLRILSGKREEE